MVKTNKREVIVELQFPGFDKKDITIKLSKNRADISAEKSIHKKVNKKDFYHEEKTYHHYNYSTTLPSINHKKAKTEFKKGVLKITAPKN